MKGSITKDKRYKPSIINKDEFSAISTPELQKMFECFRDALIEMCPVKDPSKIDDLAEEFAERFGFLLLEGIDEYLTKFREDIMVEVDQKIQEANASANARYNPAK
jgi:hypothetical protein